MAKYFFGLGYESNLREISYQQLYLHSFDI